MNTIMTTMKLYNNNNDNNYKRSECILGGFLDRHGHVTIDMKVVLVMVVVRRGNIPCRSRTSS
jgi:hypothetical protein